jgi:putative NIF3 family GTP cyclohydrolase 1 type 2
MIAHELYSQLNKDFIKGGITDLNWAARMPNLDQYLHAGFKQTGMGLMCDFTNSIEKVYTTVFLSDKVLSKILSDNVTNALIFSHHPTNWDIKNHNGNYAATEDYIIKLRERNISIYTMHHPLDNYGDYSTCKTLADKLKINIEKAGFLYFGALCGITGTTNFKNINELHEDFSKALKHKTSLYQYGRENIKGEKIAICPGGGNAPFILDEMLNNHIKILITGVTLVNEYSEKTHKLEKENQINLLGGTHYSTEKFAPMEMCKYFSNLGLPAEFVEDEPDLYDL